MYKRNILLLIIVVIVLNLAAWLSPQIGTYNLCDWYTKYITPVWYNIFGRISNVFPFSVGEIMIVAGVVLTAIAIINLILLFFYRKNIKFISYSKGFYKVFSYIAVSVCLVMTLNCTILYHVTPIDPNPEKEYREYTITELEVLRNYIVNKCINYSNVIERDDDGNIIYNGDIMDKSKEALRNIAKEYPKLSGYYPDVKPMMFSGIMSQSYIAGYYFPFSMEANFNDKMYITNYPNVYCHELAHLHGYIYEDEANFLSFLACINSGDTFFEYSGYLSILFYVDTAYQDSINNNVQKYDKQVKIPDEVYDDSAFLTEEKWDEVLEKSIIDTETMDYVSDVFTDTSLKLNGVDEGIASYDAVVDLVLQYYEGILY